MLKLINDEMEWMRGTSEVECYFDDELCVYDIPTALTDAEMVEIIGNSIYSLTNDYMMAAEFVLELSRRLGVGGGVRTTSEMSDIAKGLWNE